MFVKKVFGTRKKKIVMGILGIFLLFSILVSISLYPFINLEKILKNHKTAEAWSEMEEKYHPNDFILCKFDLTKPKFILVESFRKGETGHFNLTFYNSNRESIFSHEVKLEYNGSADVYHTTFQNLVDMVKEDCSQFKKDNNGYTGADPSGMVWTYYAPPTKEEIEAEKKRIEEKENKRYYGYTEDEIIKLVQDNYDSQPVEFQQKVDEIPYTGTIQDFADCLVEYGVIEGNN